MRMDDLDRERSKPEFAEAAIEDLRWLGIRWQEGPGYSAAPIDILDKVSVESASPAINPEDKVSLNFLPTPKPGGSRGPYYQSKRHALYYAAFRKLLRRGYLYPCRCSRKDLASAVSAPHEGGAEPRENGRSNLRTDSPNDQARHDPNDEPIYPGTCRHMIAEHQLPGPTATRFAPELANWRFRVNDGVAVEFEDLHLGPQTFVAGVDFGDFLVWRRDGLPSYQLACAVDDAAMGITEVVRGADLLKSTARQILLLRAFGVTPPDWYHCALVADHNGQRLAKRHDALALRTLRARGITPMNIFSAELPVLA
jgi:glutamyl-tRNA synthetase